MAGRGEARGRSHRTAVRVGVISDTHGSLPTSVVDLLEGVDHIIHAGDVEGLEILDRLSLIAPVTAVLGNMDRGSSLPHTPRTDTVELGGVFIHVLHDIYALDLDPEAAGFQVVIHGHTHRPEVRKVGEVLYLNPGSTTRPRVERGPSMAFLDLRDGRVHAQIVYLQ